MKLVTGSDYPPYVDDDLPGGGLITRAVLSAFAAAGWPVELTVEPWRRGYEGTLAGRFDATFPYIRTTQREGELLFSDPIVMVRQHLVVAIGQRDAAAAPGWMKGRLVCAGVGYGLPPWLEAMIHNGEVQRITPGQQRSCLAMIAAGRADFMVEDARIAAARLAEPGAARNVAVVPSPDTREASLHLVIARTHPHAQQILALFNQGLAKAKADGTAPAMVPLGPPS
ncbi:substrate-binding periplasmic protein [Niveispirillum fermenti]|uniref:substrate-binding periplasmic protein n=1 Tax=Niveispirillum fermenti TaxID=1233113 RepID=UPI003A84BFC3